VQMITALAGYIDERCKCSGCGSEDHNKEKCPKTAGKASGNPTSPRTASDGGANMHTNNECFYCVMNGHIERDCWAKARDVANGTVHPPRASVNSTGQSNQANCNGGSKPRPPQRIQRCKSCLCFGNSWERCSSSNNPPTGMSTAGTAAAATRIDQADSDSPEQEDTRSPASTYVYTYMGSFVNESQPPPIACFSGPLAADRGNAGTTHGSELVDELTSTDHGSNLALTTFCMLSNIPANDEMLPITGEEAQAVGFSVPSSREAPSPTCPMWSVTQTIRNENMLTICDTGAARNAVARHTITAVGSKWSEKVDISFINADGLKHKPLGMFHAFPFQIGKIKFKTKVYVLEMHHSSSCLV
jgi:hypothetical protein